MASCALSVRPSVAADLATSLPRYFQKIAHKHYCHYYDKAAFFDLKERKRSYTPFKPGEENQEIANLYVNYKHQKELLVKEFEKAWNDILDVYIKEDSPTDFQKSGSNMLYDLKHKHASGDF